MAVGQLPRPRPSWFLVRRDFCAKRSFFFTTYIRHAVSRQVRCAQKNELDSPHIPRAFPRIPTHSHALPPIPIRPYPTHSPRRVVPSHSPRTAHSHALPTHSHAFPMHSRVFFPQLVPRSWRGRCRQKRAAAGGSGSTRAKRRGMPVSARTVLVALSSTSVSNCTTKGNEAV
jgi:hypothetical protein